MQSKTLQDPSDVEARDPEESRLRLSADLVREARERITECMDDWETPEDVWLLTEQDMAEDWDFVESCLLRALETLDRKALIETA